MRAFLNTCLSTSLCACLILLLFARPLSAQTIFTDGFEGEPVVVASSGGIGTNLEGVEDFSAAYPFADFFKQSRPWITASQTVFDTDQADELDLDDQGWVRSLPACNAGNPGAYCFARTVFNSAGSDWPEGAYVVCYRGSGTLSYSGSASLQSSGSSAACPRRDVVNVSGDSIWIMTVESTGPAPDHLRDIRVYPPGIDENDPPLFHPEFLAELTPYRTLRFMDWMRTNGGGFGGAPNPQVTAADRSLPDDAHYTREEGVPWEVMIALANESGSEPWFTVPHQADEGWVTALATMIRDDLVADRRIYIEHSNEVWNNFPQGGDVQAVGEATFASSGASVFEKRLNQHGLRTRRICDIFRSVFAAESARIECVFGAQAANAFTAAEAADCPLAVSAALVSGGCAQAGDSIAIAPYFGNYLDLPSNADEIELWSLADLFTELQDGAQLADDMANSSTPCTENFPQNTTLPCPSGALEEIVGWLDDNQGVAQARGVSMIAYEGGQHLVGVFGVENNTTITGLFVAANRDTRMADAYARYLQDWKDSGGELFVHFNLSFGYGRFGSWGALESLGQSPRPPKAQAIDDFNDSNPCWWPDCGVDRSKPSDPGPP